MGLLIFVQPRRCEVKLQQVTKWQIAAASLKGLE